MKHGISSTDNKHSKFCFDICRILGKRVAELEKKLKTLEVAGLWTLPVGAGSGGELLVHLKMYAEFRGLEDLINGLR